LINVLVVDDQILIRAGLAALIRAADGLDVVGEAADGREAVALATSLRPHVIVMDIRMPRLNGPAATEQILAHAPQPAPRILILTTFDLDEYVYAALRAGASGFLLKDTPPERLLAAIHTVAAGDTLLAPTVTQRLVEAYAPPPRSNQMDLASLTAREIDVLRLVGTGQSNGDIAAQLFVTEATVCQRRPKIDPLSPVEY
jgi:DNA-binding NarL/FixJ family response regulator